MTSDALGAQCVNGTRPVLKEFELKWARTEYCDSTKGNSWQTGNTNLILKLREFALLTT